MSDYPVYTVKDEVDIRDSVGVYCPARVLEDRPEIVIQYLGWGKEWNETICDLDRIHPGGTKVIRSKAWVNINKKIKYWPCILYVRTPDNEEAMKYLKSELRMYIQPCGPIHKYASGFKHGAWVTTDKIFHWHDNYDEKVREGLTKWKGFDKALQELNQVPHIYEHRFSLQGTYDSSPSPIPTQVVANKKTSSKRYWIEINEPNSQIFVNIDNSTAAGDHERLKRGGPFGEMDYTYLDLTDANFIQGGLSKENSNSAMDLTRLLSKDESFLFDIEVESTIV